MWHAALLIMNRSDRSHAIANRRFISHFGTTPTVASLCWQLIPNHPRGSHPKHLLWALLFLKLYRSENVHASMVGCDEKTFRKWCRKYIILISRMDVVSYGPLMLS